LAHQFIQRRREVNELATEKELHELIGRAVADPEFRAALLDDAAKAVAEAGYELTAEQLTGLRATDLKALSEGLDERLSKEYCWSEGEHGL
jgi:hypothetical protein